MSNTHRDNLRAKQKRGLVKYDWHWLCEWPAWWDTMFHRRPARRKQKALLSKINRPSNITGRDPGDGHWPDGKKPHTYFW